MGERVTVVDAAMYMRVFEQHAEGALVLEDLVKRYARGPVYTGGIDGIRKSDHNAGARSVVEFITARLNQAHGVQDHEDHEE